MNRLILVILLGSLLACNQKSENLINIDDIPLTGGYRGVLVHNFDSIFLISSIHYNSFFLTDTTGKVKRKFLRLKITFGKHHFDCKKT